MTTTNTFEFDNDYYNFDNANEFLQNISGAVSSLSPLSEDEQFRNFADVNNWNSEGINENGIFKNKVGNNVNVLNQEYSNPNINNASGENNVWSEVMDGREIQAPTNLISSSMSSGTYSQDSTNNGMTPLSQPSLTSTHTSPELSVKIEESYDPRVEIKHTAISKNAKVTKPPKKDKSSHNMIEKKYRTNINSKILELRDAVPSLRITAGNKNVSAAELEGLTPASKLNKASVLTKATEYIKHLECKNNILKQQNFQLHRLIQEANLRPPALAQEHAMPSQRGGFGYVPPQDEQNYNTTTQSFSGGSFNFNNQNGGANTSNTSNANYNYNKILLGSLATVMGTSLLADDGNDFKGLSSLPFSSFLPYSLTHPSPLTIRLWELVKVLLVLSSVASLIIPGLLNPLQGNKKPDQGPANNLKFWFLNSLGLQLPHPYEQERVENILLMLSGKSNEEFSWVNLFNNYVYLTSCEATFELCFLNLIIGRMLSSKFPLLSRFINYNMSLKGSLLLNLDYKGKNKSLIKLSKLIHEVDGVSMLGSNSLLTRISNIALHKNINDDLHDGQNNLKYVEFFQENNYDYYNVIFSWRILEITHELNLAYLKNATSINQDNMKIDNQIVKDVDKIEDILLKNDTSVTNLKRHFSLFKSVIKYDSSIELLKLIEADVTESLSKFENIKERESIMEEDISDFSEEDIEALEAKDSDQWDSYSNDNRQTDRFSISSRKSLIGSLNLVSEEQFVVLSSALILYYHQHKNSKSNELLRYLNFSAKNIPLSLLSFTALLKVVTVLINQGEDASDFTNSNVLDQLIRITRLWINDDSKQFLGNDLRGDLSDLIVSKGMLLNGVESDESDEDRE